ncbi:MAG: helix-hairpin-helix domain-containing protein [Phycisphaeraceae bacterium]|nr:helix-hairpin-helix domain-containing protein [Phycisphaeraceae bacterium]
MADEASGGRAHDAILAFGFVVLVLVLGGMAVWYFNLEPPGRSPVSGTNLKIAVNVNTADARLLQLLPGVGPALSQRIVAERDRGGPFEDPKDLADRVEGLGPVKIADLGPHLLFELEPDDESDSPELPAPVADPQPEAESSPPAPQGSSS